MAIEKKRTGKKVKFDNHPPDLKADTPNIIEASRSGEPSDTNPPVPDERVAAEDPQMGEGPSGGPSTSINPGGDTEDKVIDGPEAARGSDDGPGNDGRVVTGSEKGDGGKLDVVGHPTVGSDRPEKGDGSAHRKPNNGRRVVKKIYIIRGRDGYRKRQRGKRQRSRDKVPDSDSSEKSESDGSDSDTASDSSEDSLVSKYIRNPKRKRKEVKSKKPDVTPKEDSPAPESPPRYRMPSFRFI